MKTVLLSVPVVGMVRKVLPHQKKRAGIGALFALKALPGWAIAVALAGFLWSIRSSSRRKAEALRGAELE